MTAVTSAELRRDRRRERREEEMEAAALRLFVAQGVDATTVQQITEAADVAKGTFFNYFDSKHDVLAKRLNRLGHRLVAFIEEEDGEEPLVRLDRHFRRAEELFRAEGSQMLLLYREALVRPDLRTIDTEVEQQILDHYSSLLARGQKEGRLRRSFDTRLGAHLINDVWASTLRSWMSCGGSFGLADRLAEKIRLAFDGFRRRPKSQREK